ncbi:MAG: type II toxin-antitoxin system RelE/ParE family toxin [Rhodospirillaceae bacterium]|jgi:toxin ParE1/3/4|nr:type II toxin-antitoxin system RelE/ParE family toxin [Rhodospirillaceae bacterium]MBT4046567.1 type II toxin-antitoxin system RelE/ParE family toxin [Rhodospirillaceae bacterium]MBT4689117.1 type II toxin-antitoxin system RelE/ParE family toxin [Rhodospirillaceae bacterium]MBT5079720.1 type II toxin-antitoxin system RelE/ParE family toxin [Rhodospirillaceae bacterium]MBT5527281.1 type II toxin-antitoxin system RelE/ParE family toxin [Rhodospirillaceae bacterium]
MKVEYSAQADADIIEGYLYGFKNFGIVQAEKYEHALRHAIGIIADNPYIAAERPEYSPPVRIHHHARHYIIHLINDDHILIVRILRDEMDLMKQLRGDA